ncbi:MAG: dienelactone hydrolase family protein [Deltaproteobacteria bacterium]|nr:dienelactone hydrolase family protein [Deltaproteobacteria bacterium]MBW2412900.1 dienelactone hydrolase family protein [Deltaproteobacteria bacterium]
MAGELIEFPSNGSTTPGYLSKPASGSGPAVIVIQEWWGLVDHIKQVADRFAAEGFVALAPDMYHGESTDSPDDAGRLMMALDIDRAATDLSGAVGYLCGLDEVTAAKVGTVGFCMGGQLALATACRSEQVGACADFYGVHPNVTLDFSALRAPVLGVFAENDEFVSPEVARKLEHDLKSAGAQTDFHIYPGVDHAFFNDSRPDVYNESAANDAWQRTVEFFRAHLA